MRMDPVSSFVFAEPQLHAFAAALGRAHGLNLQDPDRLQAYACEHYREFWLQLLAWAGLPCSGEASPVCTDDRGEHARFFPNLRLNYAESLLQGGAADAVALVSRRADGCHVRLTYGQLRHDVECAAQALRRHGLSPGDQVVAVLRNDDRAAVAALAVAAVGASLAIAAPETGVPTVLSRWRGLRPKLLLAHVGALPHDTGMPLAQRVVQLASALPTLALQVAVDDAASAASGTGGLQNLGELMRIRMRTAAQPFAWQRHAFDQPLFITASALAEGGPPGLLHSAGGVLLEHVKEHRLHCDLRDTDRLFFQTSCAWMMWPWQLSALASGCSIVLYDGPIRDPSTLWQIVGEERVTVFGCSPPYLKLGEHAGLVPGRMHDLGLLRAILCAGPSLYEPVRRWVRERVKPVPVHTLLASPDLLACLLLGAPPSGLVAAPLSPSEPEAGPISRSLGMDLRTAGAQSELVCLNAFPARPLGFVGDAQGTRLHAIGYARHGPAWCDGSRVVFTPQGGARVLGRCDGVLQVRGIHIDPNEVFEVLQAFPQIESARIVEQHSSASFSEGRAVLLLVMREGDVLDGEITAHIRRRLAEAASAAHVPDVILALPELPRSARGEVAMQALADAVNGRAPAPGDQVVNPGCLQALLQSPALRSPDPLTLDMPPPPAPGWRSRQDHEAYLRLLWERVFGFAPIGLDDDFFELGGHSLLAARMLADIRRSTGQELALGTLLKAPTVRQLAALMDEAAWDLPVPLVQLRPGTGRPFFLVHSLAGTFLEMWAVLRALDTSRPVFGLQARGLGSGQQPHLRVVDMARDYIGHMRRVQPHGPYAVGGYSFGGLIAFEIAQQLRRAGETVELLGLIDTHVHGRYLPLGQWVQHRVARLTGLLRRLESLPRRERWDYLRKKACVVMDRLRLRAGLAPLHPELVGDVLREANFPPALRRVRGAMIVAFREYRPEPYPGRVLFLRAAEPGDSDPLPVWRKVVQGGLDVSVTPGNHDEMIAGANAKALALALARHLRG